jgi:hypothetical protein
MPSLARHANDHDTTLPLPELPQLPQIDASPRAFLHFIENLVGNCRRAKYMMSQKLKLFELSVLYIYACWKHAVWYMAEIRS